MAKAKATETVEFVVAAGPSLDALPKARRGVNLDNARAILATVRAHGTATDGRSYDTAADAAKSARLFVKLLRAVEPEGESVRVRIIETGGTFRFAVWLAKARKGKGEPRNR